MSERHSNNLKRLEQKKSSIFGKWVPVMTVGILFVVLILGISTSEGSTLRNNELPEKNKDYNFSDEPLDVISLTRELVNIPSISNEEHDVALWLGEYLSSLNWTVEYQLVERQDSPDAGPPRYNIFAWKGQRNAPLLVNSHLDTVPPFIPISEDDENLYGRGTTDAKSQISTQIVAVEELISDGLIREGAVNLLYVVGEENAGDGMRAANDLGIVPQYLIVGEPTEQLLATGHKAPLSFTIQSEGRAAHSGYPELGLSAISPLIRVLRQLNKEEWPFDPILGATTLNIGEIDGGVAANVVPAYAESRIMVRVTTSTTEVLTRVSEIIDELGNSQVKLVAPASSYEPVFLDTVPGFETGFMSYGTDIPYFEGDHKRYLYGCGSITVAHSNDEFVPKNELVLTVARFKQLVLAVLNQEI